MVIDQGTEGARPYILAADKAQPIEPLVIGEAAIHADANCRRHATSTPQAVRYPGATARRRPVLLLLVVGTESRIACEWMSARSRPSRPSGAQAQRRFACRPR